MVSKCKYKARRRNKIFRTRSGLLEGFLDSRAQANYDSYSVQAAVQHGFH